MDGDDDDDDDSNTTPCKSFLDLRSKKNACPLHKS